MNKYIYDELNHFGEKIIKKLSTKYLKIEVLISSLNLVDYDDNSECGIISLMNKYINIIKCENITESKSYRNKLLHYISCYNNYYYEDNLYTIEYLNKSIDFKEMNLILKKKEVNVNKKVSKI